MQDRLGWKRRGAARDRALKLSIGAFVTEFLRAQARQSVSVLAEQAVLGAAVGGKQALINAAQAHTADSAKAFAVDIACAALSAHTEGALAERSHLERRATPKTSGAVVVLAATIQAVSGRGAVRVCGAGLARRGLFFN